jgi:hypothetical protein
VVFSWHGVILNGAPVYQAENKKPAGLANRRANSTGRF